MLIYCPNTSLLSHVELGYHINNTSPPIPTKLDSINYRVWYKVLELQISGREKKVIPQKNVTPTADDSSYDALIRSELILSVIGNLMSHFVQYGIDKEV